MIGKRPFSQVASIGLRDPLTFRNFYPYFLSNVVQSDRISWIDLIERTRLKRQLNIALDAISGGDTWFAEEPVS